MSELKPGKKIVFQGENGDQISVEAGDTAGSYEFQSKKSGTQKFKIEAYQTIIHPPPPFDFPVTVLNTGKSSLDVGEE